VRYAVPRHVSFDAYAERLSSEESPLPPADTTLQRIRDKAQQAPELMLSVLGGLPAVDHEICRLYFVEGLSQEGVSSLVGIGQPEVSGRLHSCIKLLQFLAKRPTRDPIQLRNDFLELLPRHLVEVAHSLYLNFSPSRVADRFKVSEGTMRNLQKEIVEHLKKLAALPARGPYEHAALANLGMIDAAGALADNEVARRRELASRYLEDFGRLKEVSARLVRVSRKNEGNRANALIKGEPIIGPSAS
jgi:DNA-directed RNA polymerase specialized sigma24 family protein